MITQIQLDVLHVEIEDEDVLRTKPQKRSFQFSDCLTFHIYVATVQQHLNMEHISLSWYDIPELKVHIMIFLRGLCQQRGYWTKGSYLFIWMHKFESFTVAPHDLVNLYGICVTNDHGYVSLVVTPTGPFLIHDLSPGL
jgi:hypothetical protein